MCARQLTGHINYKHAVQAALSPDLLMVAVGSEDRTVVVYDLRTGGVLAKLRGAKDVVTSVGWSPRTEHLLAGSLDGSVRAYTTAEAAGVAAPGR
jgi:WD40 repeat protein